MITRDIENAVTMAVDFLLPRGSCSTGRWLTFEFEGKSNRSKFNWKAQYSAPTGYVYWRTIYGNVPHVKVADYADDLHPYSPWVPQELYNATKNGDPGPMNTAPGFVIADGRHDSCWRDNACRVSGYPRVPRNTYPSDGKNRINFEMTSWFPIYDNPTITTKNISIVGPVGTESFLSKMGAESFKHFTDGTWENDVGLTGPWAIYHGMSKLAQAVGKEYLEIRIIGDVSKGELDTDAYEEGSFCTHYRIKDGLVTHVGIPNKENDWFIEGWAEVATPYLLTEERFIFDGGMVAEGHDGWGLHHISSGLI